MANKDCCFKCGAHLLESTPHDLCPKCLMKVGFEEDADAALEESPLIEGPGTKIGHYELLELIGEGGMGLVYLADQKKPVKRKVALKIVKLGMDTKQVVARFEVERQTLALLEHPNIAHVFDAGTTETGRPYFVMEYVEGKSITKYCDEHRLSVEERLELFKKVCEGIHHAHQKGIIHRDLKPSNILVSVHGGRATPKIIDFGIAKAITQPLTEKTFYTEQGQLLGTPEYMSPEQAEMAYHNVDTRSDIYSLGVMLYELLAGATPFDAKKLREGGIDQIKRVICDEEPRTPSARLTSLGDKAKAVAESRRTQIITLTRRLHRELEWIPMKAMRKDRSRRYRSASELSDDIQNYLTGTPLIAGPESTVYRTRKFVRKHAGSVATAALLLVVIILGLVVSIVMGCRAEEARQQEVIVRQQVEQALARAEKAERIAQEQRKLAEERAEAYRCAVYGNTLALAKEAIDDDSFSHAQTLLKSCEPDLRGWEWEHLNYMSPDPCIRTLYGHWDDVYSLAVSPDGKRMASAGGEGRIRIWDTASGHVVMTLSVHSRPYVVVYSPDGKRIATGSQDGSLRIWDAVTGARLMTVYAHKSWLGSLVFSPDSTRIVSGNSDTMKVWDVNSGTELLTIQGHQSSAPWRRIAFSPDGKLVVSGSDDKSIKAWDAVTGAEMKTFTGHDSVVACVSYSPDGSRLVSGDGDGIIKVWDAVTGAEIRTLTGHTMNIAEVVFSPDGKRIASGSYDKTVKIWDVDSGDELKTLRGHDRQVTAIVFRPDGERLFSTCFLRGLVKEWDPHIDRDVLRLHGAGLDTAQVAFSPDGQRIAGSVGSFQRKRLTLWDAVSGAEMMTFGGRWEPLAFSPDGKRIAASGRDRRINIWNAVTGTLERTLTGHANWVLSVAFSPDSTRIVSGSRRDETVKIWNAATGDTELTITTGQDSVNSVIFSTDGKRIISGGADGTVRILDALSGAQLLILHGHEGPVWEVSVSSDGNRFASCGDDKTVRVWDAVSGDELMTLNGHESSIRTVAFSPDGMRIISGGKGGQIKIWDAGTGTEIIDLCADPTNNIKSAAFSPDGKSICVGTDQGGVMLWESVKPAGGYGPRQTANLARDLVDELYKEHASYNNVISRLEEDSTINDSVRKAALQLANDRLGREETKLSEYQSWAVVSSPDRNKAEYRKVLETEEKASSSQPNYISSITRLGIAQYRLGAYEEALTTLARAKKMRDDAGHEFDDSMIAGFRAMALQQLGREAEVHAIIQQVRRGSRDSRWNKTRRSYGLPLVTEVEKFFAGQDSTLVSIWELIGDDELDEAADIVEEVRLSKNAERINRMEGSGAAELLSLLYDERGIYRWKNGGESSALIADHERAVRIDPNNIEALTELGRIYLNWPDPDIHDAKKAAEAATRACELTDWKDHETINILAAACSEAGDLENAVKWQKTALELLPRDCPAAFKANYQAQLDLYESGKPYNKGGAWSFSDGELVSHWAFDEVQAGEVFDSTGKGHRGRLVGDANIVSDPERGNVLKLGRKGDYVDCGWHPGFKITGAMTIAVWTKVTELNSASEEIITTDSASLRLSGGSEFSCESSALYKGGGVLGTLDGDVLGTAFGQESQWHLIVVRYEGEELNFYIDGEPTSSAHWTANRKHFCGNIEMDMGPLTIGPRYNRQPMENPRGWKDMLIDDVRIYSYALSPDEVKMLYEGKEPPQKKGL